MMQLMTTNPRCDTALIPAFFFPLFRADVVGKVVIVVGEVVVGEVVIVGKVVIVVCTMDVVLPPGELVAVDAGKVPKVNDGKALLGS